MTLIDRPWTPSDAGGSAGGREVDRPQQQQRQINVSSGERAVSVAAGGVLGMLALNRGGIPGLLAAAAGAAMIHRGVTGHCHLYNTLGVDTAHPEDEHHLRQQKLAEQGVHIETALLINRPAEELYRFWRDFTNLPRIMTHLERVDVTDGADGRRSHWVAKAPRLLGGTVEWDAEITRDEPDTVIAWQSLPGADVDNAGEVRFAKAPADRGTEVHVTMRYLPPAGKVGHFIAALLGDNPKRVVREDLRNFKRTMELGEILTLIGQPHGSCAGRGKPYTESEWRPLFT